MPGNPSIGNPFPYAIEAILEGLNATQALSIIRAEGGGISTQAWYRAYGEASQAIANVQSTSSVDLFSTPGRDQFVEWTAGRAPGFVYQFGLDVVDPETGLTITIPHTVITSEPISIGAALGIAIGDFQEGEVSGTSPGDFVAPSSVDLLYMTGTAAGAGA